MPLRINIRHLEKKALDLEGELDPAELGLDQLDELIHATLPLQYTLEAQLLEDSVLVQGDVEITLNCECSRCLKPYTHLIDLPGWAAHLPLEGEDRVTVDNDLVDLTPYLREDILLNIPQHPLCEPECSGLSKKQPSGIEKKPSGASQSVESSSAWAELNKLKFEKE